MSRTVAGYLSDLKAKTGRNNSTVFDTAIYDMLNDLFELVETDPEKLWFFDKTVQFSLGVSDIGANGAILDMPSDLEHIYDMFLVDTALNAYTEVKPIAVHEAKKKYGPTDSGEPERYSDEGSSIRFWPPSPDQTYTVEMSYKAKLTRVSATSDTNDFMENYHGLIMDGLLAEAWESLGQEDRAGRYWQKWSAKWADLRASNVARILSGDIQFAPRTDVNATPETERGGNKLTWGGN